jgi:hypothetical protein
MDKKRGCLKRAASFVFFSKKKRKPKHSSLGASRYLACVMIQEINEACSGDFLYGRRSGI